MEEQFGDRGSESYGLAQLKVGDNDLEYFFFKYREGGICSLSTFPKYFFKKKYHFLFISKLGLRASYEVGMCASYWER